MLLKPSKLRLNQLIPSRFKLWLVTRLPFIAWYNRALTNYRVKLAEPKLLKNLIKKTEIKLTLNEEIHSRVVINVLNITDSKNKNPNRELEQKNIKHWTIPSDSINQKLLEKLFSQIDDSEYFCFIQDNADSFLKNALQFISKNIAENQFPELIYWDNLLKNPTGEIIGHNFKPNWSSDYLTCFNYINRSTAIKKSVIDNKFIQLANKNFEAALYYLFLKETKLKSSYKILHIDEPLQILIDKQHLKTAKSQQELELIITKELLSNKAEVFIKKDGIRGVRYNPPLRLITSTIIIPTRNGHKILKKCIDSILKSDLQDVDKILIIDNQSNCQETIQYLQYLAEQNIAKVLSYPYHFNYSSINNYAVKHCDSEVIVLLNNDIEVLSKNWLAQLKINAIRPGIGCVGAKLYYPDKTIQHAGVIVGSGGVADHAFKYEKKNSEGYQYRLITDQNYSAVTAACLAIKRETYNKVEGLNEKDLSVAFNDIDLCLKVEKLNLTNLWLCDVELIHHESKTRGSDVSRKEHSRFSREVLYMKNSWKTDKINDPAFNKNLSHRNFLIKDVQLF